MVIKTKNLQPNAASMVQSMRDIGYTLNTAIADIIDNSVSAEAENIHIWYLNDSTNSKIIISDDGLGMSVDKLQDIMRLAYIDPTVERQNKDLGRFGLGLKMATFSQAKKLTVVSCVKGELACASWDLEYIIKKNEWLLQIPNIEDVNLEKEYLDFIFPHGTIVIWECIDRIDHDQSKKINSILVELRSHIGLVFHKFLSGINGIPLKIYLNNLEVEALDPFLSNNPFTHHHPLEKLNVGNSEVTIQAHIIPHHTRLSLKEEEFIRTKSDLLNNQGMYVYRNNRLMVWGEWFRIIKKSEQTKLARIEINFDKKIDTLWNIDIKKSKAYPPQKVVLRLKELIENRIAASSIRVHTSRISRTLSTSEQVWQRFTDEKKIIYRINKDFPLYKAFLEDLTVEQKKCFQMIVEIINKTLPIQSLYADVANSPKLVNNTENKYSEDDLYEKFSSILGFFKSQNFENEELRQILLNTGIFSDYEDKLIEWIKKNDT